MNNKVIVWKIHMIAVKVFKDRLLNLMNQAQKNKQKKRINHKIY